METNFIEMDPTDFADLDLSRYRLGQPTQGSPSTSIEIQPAQTNFSSQLLVTGKFDVPALVRGLTHRPRPWPAP